MKFLNLLVWVTQFGLSCLFPLCFFLLLAVWLQSRFDLGAWVIWTGVALGVICAIDGLRTSLKAMDRLANHKADPEPPPVAFNDHD